MILAFALIEGFQKEISSKIFGFWGHIHITDTNINRSFEAIPIDLNQDFYPDLDTVGQVSYPCEKMIFGYQYAETGACETKGGIDYVQPFILVPGIIKTKKLLEGIILKGFDKDFRTEKLEPFLKDGAFPVLNDSVPSREVILSEQTAQRLKLKVGDRLTVHFVQEGDQLKRGFTVGGIYKTGLEEYDQKFALIDLRVLQQILGWQEDQVSGFEVFVENISDLDPLNDFVYLDVLPGDLYSETIRDKFPAIFEWLELQDINKVVILLLLMIVAIINMVTTLLILILERTKMIGMLKSLGQTDWNIRKIFLYHAGIIILHGMFWGNLFGIGACWLQKKFEFIKLSEADYYLNVAPVDINIWAILLINICTLAIIILFLLIPSYLVARIQPVKALRFK